MLIEIESYLGDAMLSGRPVSRLTLARRLRRAARASRHDRDHFLSILCTRYGWEVVPDGGGRPAYFFDLDTDYLKRLVK